ncbi:MAG TPA: hypothetical protein DIU37_04740 [Opitutae bacterium]|nr:hypothetical protein [Opitutae bacterium]|tara:strand:- start:97 stop:696 length:600 start_codon:yes stop_codon:yes gene_type:complete
MSLKTSNIHIAEGLSKLFYPHVEVVLHSIAHNHIIHIANPFSGRKVGDPSLLDSGTDWDASPSILGPYEKKDPKGNAMRSISIVLKNAENEADALMCINFDTRVFEKIQHLLGGFFAQSLTAKPDALFKDDWQERIHAYVHRYLQDKGASIESLNTEARRNLVLELDRAGALEAKNATEHIAKILNISRGTVYNYLRSE